MIHLTKIEVRGKAEAGEFSGVLELSSGLQVISAHNAYGKSLAVKAIAWCFGLEPIFGNADNDPIRLPEAVREDLELGGHVNSRVLSSECAITIRDQAGRQLVITRAIKGGDPSTVVVREVAPDGRARESKLLARKVTMQDQHGGFQRFLFGWLNWPRIEVPTFRPGGSEIYLENLAPLFYIDQNEGWTNIQALQVARYGQQQIGEIAVEYLLGATDALKVRVSKLQATQRASELKESARLIAEQLTEALLRRGWRVEWSSHGTISDIVIQMVQAQGARSSACRCFCGSGCALEGYQRANTATPKNPYDATNRHEQLFCSHRRLAEGYTTERAAAHTEPGSTHPSFPIRASIEPAGKS